MEVFLLLDHSIRHGDLGLLRQALGECSVVVQATESSKPKYAKELIRLIHMVDSPAASPELQNAILASCLDNLVVRLILI